MIYKQQLCSCISFYSQLVFSASLTTFTDGVIKQTEIINCMRHGDTKINTVVGTFEGRKYFGDTEVDWWVLLK
jgi:hypothetical protein